MRHFLEALRTRLTGGEDMALVLVVERTGSAPRGAGARMLVGQGGRVWGTVGGGLIEQRAEEMALEALSTKACVVQEFSLDGDRLEGIGMVCGGDVTLAVQYLPAGDQGLLALTDAALARLDTGGDGWLLTTLTGPEAGTIGLMTPAEAAQVLAAHMGPGAEQVLAAHMGPGAEQVLFEGSGLQFAQRLARPGAVYLFGGGHVARELAPLLARLDFRHTVVDDRAEFAPPGDFPGAERVFCAPFTHILDVVTPGAGDYAVVMTHGHGFDLEVQRQLLATPVGYIGVMGSRKKKAFVFGKLRELGFTEGDLERITTPVGLPLGGETPAEIALSIAAQLVQLRAQGAADRP